MGGGWGGVYPRAGIKDRKAMFEKRTVEPFLKNEPPTVRANHDASKNTVDTGVPPCVWSLGFGRFVVLTGMAQLLNVTSSAKVAVPRFSTLMAAPPAA